MLEARTTSAPAGRPRRIRLLARARSRRRTRRGIGLAALRALVLDGLARTFLRVTLVALLQPADGVLAVGRGGVRLASILRVHAVSSCEWIGSIDRYAQHPRAASWRWQGRAVGVRIAGAIAQLAG